MVAELVNGRIGDDVFHQSLIAQSARAVIGVGITITRKQFSQVNSKIQKRSGIFQCRPSLLVAFIGHEVFIRLSSLINLTHIKPDCRFNFLERHQFKIIGLPSQFISNQWIGVADYVNDIIPSCQFGRTATIGFKDDQLKLVAFLHFVNNIT